MCFAQTQSLLLVWVLDISLTFADICDYALTVRFDSLSKTRKEDKSCQMSNGSRPSGLCGLAPDLRWSALWDGSHFCCVRGISGSFGDKHVNLLPQRFRRKEKFLVCWSQVLPSRCSSVEKTDFIGQLKVTKPDEVPAWTQLLWRSLSHCGLNMAAVH